MSKIFSKILVPINKLIRILMILSFSIMVILIFAQIIYRYVLIRPIPWAEEAARFFFVWATFLGASVAVKNRAHINVSFLVDKISVNYKKYEKPLILSSYILCIIFLSAITFYGLRISFHVNKQTSPALQLPMIYPYLAIPIGTFMMVINFIAILLEEIENHKATSPKK
ncbi:MAG: TRAP transporter small permease [Candidatus Atribacteria bacterium]|nr:TRAP transporter small permease [Candidatus Atribacteria bacterium]